MERITEVNEQILYENPKVLTINNIISDEECNHMINIATPNLVDSVVSDDKGGYVSKGRTSKTSWILHNYDNITKSIAERIAKIVGAPLINAERYQVVYYGVSHEYRQHYDAWEHDGSDKALRCIKQGGQRLWTALVYLNDVEEGGDTRFTKLDINVKAEKGKLLIFQNTLTDTNIKHPLSEHAGMPVVKGEKYIFNLWFRECERTRLYSDFNPEYYKNPKTNGDMYKIKITDSEKIKNLKKISNTKNIFKACDILPDNQCKEIIEKCNFTANENGNKWINKTQYPLLIKKLEEMTKVESRFYENINAIQYKSKNNHGPFYDAYDVNSENSKQFIERLGQRFKTIVISLSDTIFYNFNKIKTEVEMKKGTLILYDNVLNSRQRDETMIHSITNNLDKDVCLINIYIREKDITGRLNTIFNFKENTLKESITLDIKEKEDYINTYHHVLNLFKEQKISKHWNSYKSFTYILKGDFDNVCDYILKFKSLVDDNKGLNKKLLDVDYNFDEYNPVNLNDTVHPELLDLLQTYYRTSIENNVFPLGDRQSNRYKSNNEAISRFLHYEMLPLIEKITNTKLRPTYTYLSCYINGCDLPAHTDREDCEYTVSFLINKDKDWPIYLHKVKQHKKHLGRTKERYVDKSECIELNGESGGFIIFCGCDHAHYREVFEGTFYDILLLHYRCV
tara:strand:+ start:4147 stop:6189 length:2043 start_codon:yes stop_codon:yes gene_type:complete